MKLIARVAASALAVAVLVAQPVPQARAATLPDGLQKITVVAHSPTSSYAWLSTWKSSGGRWVRALPGPWTARVGYNGVAPPGAERENSGRTPSGSYTLGFMFGALPRPSGIVWPTWKHAYGYDVWDDDPASPRYNLWTDDRTQDAGRSPEPMRTIPQYDYAVVINYNTARTPGLGSAIFLHVSYNDPTAGCVSLPAAELLAVLRWLRSAAHPYITIRA